MDKTKRVETDKSKLTVAADDALAVSGTGSLVFISHDTRDADLAEAFSKFLKSVSAGMIKTFRSSDRKGNEGIDFGEEWYKYLMSKLQETSDVVCLFTERSIGRPWILFEAGVAKGKLNTPVLGIALGISLTHMSTGPFYQFQNCDDTEDGLTKLVQQLARRVPGLELEPDVIKSQVAVFKKAESEILKKIPTSEKKPEKKEIDTAPIAKLFEEMKYMPVRIAEHLAENGEPYKRRKMRRLHPMMAEDLMRMAGDASDPIGILMAASFIKDDLPWIYELAKEVYKVAQTGKPEIIKEELRRIHRISEYIFRGPFMEYIEYSGKEVYMLCRELPRMMDFVLRRSIDNKRQNPD